MNKWITNWPLPLRWAGGIALLGVVLAYQPAISQSGGFSLPYSGDATASGSAVASFINDATSGAGSDGLYAFTNSTDASSIALYGSSIGGSGVEGYANSGAATTGVYGIGDGNSGYGVYGQAANNYGVYGSTSGVNGNNILTAAGVFGTGSSLTAVGVLGIVTSSNPAVYGINNGSGAAVIGIGNSAQSPTGYFFNNSTSTSANGLQGRCNAGNGVTGYGKVGVYGITDVSGGNAGYFQGNVQVTGTISGAAKNFKIDHPLDPANKYLVHSCIESSAMLNLYRGNVTLDSDGQAVVEMPTWFEAENTEFSYQLTAIGSAAPDLHVAQEIEHNRFVVGGGKPGMKVSWQVTGTRQDAYARSHPLQVEQDKTGGDKGKYLDPVDYGKPAREGIGALPLKSVTGKFALPQPPLTVTPPRPLKVTPRRTPKTPSLRNAR